MPIRGPRKIYEITTITRNLDDNPDAIDNPTDEINTDESLFVKIKQGIGEFFGLEAIPWNDPRLVGTFKTFGSDTPDSAQTGATNAGSTYHRRIGGYKVASYKLLPVDTFPITEYYYDEDLRQRVAISGNFQSMSIGFPVGHKVWAFKYWLASLENFESVRAFVTPNGHKIELN